VAVLLLGVVGAGLAVALVVVLVRNSATGKLPDSAWKRFAPPGGDCTILMPGDPVPKPLPAADPGITNSRKYVVTWQRPDVSFAIAYSDLSDEATRQVSIEQRLDLEREEIRKQMRGVLVSDFNRLDARGNSWREFRIETADKKEILIERALVVPVRQSQRLYLLAVGGRQNILNNGDADRFFDSFEFFPPVVMPMKPVPQAKPDPPPVVQPKPNPAVPLATPESPPPPASILPGLILYWNLDEGDGNGAGDASGKGNHGAIKGAQWTQGIRGKALCFKGKGDYVDAGTSTQLNFAANAPFTIACWVRTSEPEGTLMAFRNSKTKKPAIQLTLRRGGITAAVTTDNHAPHKDVALDGPAINDGRWHHVALTRDAKHVALHVNGRMLCSVASTHASGAITTDLRMLALESYWAKDQGPPAAAFFNGCIDEFCIFNRALSFDEMQTLARSAKVIGP
jgi:hypothetical protein